MPWRCSAPTCTFSYSGCTYADLRVLCVPILRYCECHEVIICPFLGPIAMATTFPERDVDVSTSVRNIEIIEFYVPRQWRHTVRWMRTELIQRNEALRRACVNILEMPDNAHLFYRQIDGA